MTEVLGCCPWSCHYHLLAGLSCHVWGQRPEESGFLGGKTSPAPLFLPSPFLPSWVLYFLPIFYSFSLQARVPDLLCSLQTERKCVFQNPGNDSGSHSCGDQTGGKEISVGLASTITSSEYFLGGVFTPPEVYRDQGWFLCFS